MTQVKVALFRLWRRLPYQVRVFLIRRLTPSYWVGAMCVVERDNGAVLLVRLSYRRGWGFPGGLLKRNEQPADAAGREAEEEVGLELDLDDSPRVVVDARMRRVDIIYRARLREGAEPGDPTPRSPEILEARWFGPDDDLPLLHKEARAALAELRRARTGRPVR